MESIITRNPKECNMSVVARRLLSHLLLSCLIVVSFCVDAWHLRLPDHVSPSHGYTQDLTHNLNGLNPVIALNVSKIIGTIMLGRLPKCVNFCTTFYCNA